MVAIVDSGTTPNAVGIGNDERVATVSAVPGGSWTRTIMLPCGRLACVATWPLICCATNAASVWMFSPEAASLSVGTNWDCGLGTPRIDCDPAKPEAIG